MKVPTSYHGLLLVKVEFIKIGVYHVGLRKRRLRQNAPPESEKTKSKMAAPPSNVPTFKLILVGDGGTGTYTLSSYTPRDA